MTSWRYRVPGSGGKSAICCQPERWPSVSRPLPRAERALEPHEALLEVLPQPLRHGGGQEAVVDAIPHQLLELRVVERGIALGGEQELIREGGVEDTCVIGGEDDGDAGGEIAEE